MAAASPAESLQDEASCPICLDYFIDPVITKCGHNFCRSCILQSWEGREANFPCPQCRKTSQYANLRPNRQLANMTEIAKTFCQLSMRQQQENVCEKHQEKLKLFCEEDKKPICVVCDRSRDHKSHTVIPIAEAVQEYKEKLKIFVEPMRRQLGDVLEFKSNEEKKAEKLKRETQIKRQKIETDFEELQQFLTEEKRILLSRLEGEERKVLQRIGENVTRLEEQSSAIRLLVSEIEEKSRQPAAELLKDVKDTLSRCEKIKFPEPEAVSTDLKMDSQLNYIQQLKKLVTEFRGSRQELLPSAVEVLPSESVSATTKPGATEADPALKETKPAAATDPAPVGGDPPCSLLERTLGSAPGVLEPAPTLGPAEVGHDLGQLIAQITENMKQTQALLGKLDGAPGRSEPRPERLPDPSPPW
ncbi:E3 ubiquitin-protein ligase TRIM39-like isoform X1 [Rhinatrema bivittatum]|uniref:E3 ubiquitin-protein ligase TRIM39-like isoform X1 n=1 Tax=Rhinatrema bivittatum TaxID=194408 RepID=UPI00112A9F75|nr:E3 ubiquitin-protein ligase TRIM39-like isoform X1 [Rhinatrema bivittatum]